MKPQNYTQTPLNELLNILEKKVKSYSNKVDKIYNSVKNPNRFYNLDRIKKEITEYGK